MSRLRRLLKLLTWRGLGALASGVLVSLVVWRWGGDIPEALVPMWGESWKHLDPVAQERARGQFRLAVVQAAVAIGGVVALLYTARTFRLNRRGQVTDRFTKALERLGSDEMYVRIGGVLALEQIVQDSPDQAAHAAQVLNAFIRDRTPPAPADYLVAVGGVLGAAALRAALAGTAGPEDPEADVQAALTALVRPESRHHVSQPINLSGRHLTGAWLEGADLTDARLNGADLTGAFLRAADLHDARLDFANLTSARLHGVNLHDARLDGANLHDARLRAVDLTGAQLRTVNLTQAQLDYVNLTRALLVGVNLHSARLRGANLTDAQLDGADLRYATGLAIEQVAAACPTGTTRLPPVIAADPAVVARIAEVEAERAE